MALIEAQGLTVSGRLREASFQLRAGEMLGLIGPNGSGKSTLLHATAGLLPAAGEIHIEGMPLTSIPSRQRARRLGLLPQEGGSAWSLSVADVVALGRLPWGDEEPTAIHQAMKAARIAHLAGRRVDALSGGERARVWLARVLAGQPRILLADEPIASLDIHHQLEVMEVLRDYAGTGQGVLVALHDLALAARYCDRLLLIKDGSIIAQGTPGEVLTEERLTDAFGVAVEVDLQRQPPLVLPR